ncbi:MAG: glycosyltransferase [Segetibacter sp.]|nr:glycosyltransferase [Segetibacter sp.]
MVATGGKILIISSEFPPNVGGIGNHAYNLATALSNEGFAVTVMADIIDVPENDLDEFETKQNFKISWIKRKDFLPKTYLNRIFQAIQLSLKAEKVICSGKFPLWLAILIRIFNARKDLIAVVHGSELDIKSAIPKKLTSYSLSKFNKIVSVSTFTQQFLPKSLPRQIQQFVIHNGINCSEFQINRGSALAGTPALVTVGSVTERKGQENVVSALPSILAIFPSTKYHVIGKPVIKEKLEKKARELQVDNCVKFYGAVNRDQLLQKLSGATIKLMLSNHTKDGDFEGFGIAVLEANTFGVPVVGSKNSGIADAIVDYRTGILVNQHEPLEVTNAIKMIVKDYSFFSANAKEWALQHDWKIIVKEYVAVLKA